MKNRFFSLMPIAAVITTSPLFAIDINTESGLIAVKPQRPTLNNKEIEWIKESADNGMPSCQY